MNGLEALIARADAYRRLRANTERRLMMACLGMRDWWHRQALVHLARYAIAEIEDDRRVDKAVEAFLR